MKYSYSRKELKSHAAYEYRDGDVIEVDNGRYYIWIKYGNYTRPSFLTTVEPKESFLELPIRKQPQYIRDFIEKTKDETSLVKN